MPSQNRSIVSIWRRSLAIGALFAVSPAQAQAPEAATETNQTAQVPATPNANRVADEYFKALFQSWLARNNLAPVVLAPQASATPPPTPVVAPRTWPSARAPVPALPSIGCAENGSCYGDISSSTWKPKTVHVPGYFRRDGTYVRGHYRSH